MFQGCDSGSLGHPSVQVRPPSCAACLRYWAPGHHFLETDVQKSLTLWDGLGREFWQEGVITSSDGAGDGKSLSAPPDMHKCGRSFHGGRVTNSHHSCNKSLPWAMLCPATA